MVWLPKISPLLYKNFLDNTITITITIISSTSTVIIVQILGLFWLVIPNGILNEYIHHNTKNCIFFFFFFFSLLWSMPLGYAESTIVQDMTIYMFAVGKNRYIVHSLFHPCHSFLL